MNIKYQVYFLNKKTPDLLLDRVFLFYKIIVITLQAQYQLPSKQKQQ